MSYKSSKKLSQKNSISKNVSVSNDYFKFIELIDEELNKRFMTLTKSEGYSVLKTNDTTSKLEHSIYTKYTTFYNGGIQLTLHPYKQGVNVHLLKIDSQFQGKGIGSEIMRMIVNISDELNVPVYLIPVRIGRVSTDVLRKFYHSFGFKRLKNNRFWKYSPVKVISICENQFVLRMVG